MLKCLSLKWVLLFVSWHLYFTFPWVMYLILFLTNLDVSLHPSMNRPHLTFS